MAGHFGDKVHDLHIDPATVCHDPFELHMVFTKGMDTATAMDAAKHAIGPNTWAPTVQNGIGNVEAIETFISR
jgi:2-dehydropantoate 2-reductase